MNKFFDTIQPLVVNLCTKLIFLLLIVNTNEVLVRLGESTCQMLEYQELIDISIIVDESTDSKTKYVDIVSSMSAEKNFLNSDCSNR